MGHVSGEENSVVNQRWRTNGFVRRVGGGEETEQSKRVIAHDLCNITVIIHYQIQSHGAEIQYYTEQISILGRGSKSKCKIIGYIKLFSSHFGVLREATSKSALVSTCPSIIAPSPNFSSPLVFGRPRSAPPEQSFVLGANSHCWVRIQAEISLFLNLYQIRITFPAYESPH